MTPTSAPTPLQETQIPTVKQLTNRNAFLQLRDPIDRKIQRIQQAQKESHNYWQPEKPIKPCSDLQFKNDGDTCFFIFSPGLWCVLPATADATTHRVHNCGLYWFSHILGFIACGGCITGAVLTGLWCPPPANIVLSTLLGVSAPCSPCITDCIVSAEEHILTSWNDTHYDNKTQKEREKIRAFQRFEALKDRPLDLQGFCSTVTQLQLTVQEISPVIKQMNLAQLYEMRAHARNTFEQVAAPSLTTQQKNCLETVDSLLSTSMAEAEAAASSNEIPLQGPRNTHLLQIESIIRTDSALWLLLVEHMSDLQYALNKELLLQLSPLKNKTLIELQKIRETLIKQREKVSLLVDGNTFQVAKQTLVQFPYFQRVFNSGMQEARSNTIELKVTKEQADVFPFFLCYLEGKSLLIDRSNDFALFQLANFYEIVDLQNLCFESMKKRFTEKNNIKNECEKIKELIMHGGAPYINQLLDLCTVKTSNDALYLLECLLKQNSLLTIDWQRLRSLCDQSQNPQNVASLLLQYHKNNVEIWGYIRDNWVFSFSKNYTWLDDKFHALPPATIQAIYNTYGYKALFRSGGQQLQDDMWPHLLKEIDADKQLFKEVWEFAEEIDSTYLKNCCINYFKSFQDSSEISLLWKQKSFPQELQNVLVERFAHSFSQLSM